MDQGQSTGVYQLEVSLKYGEFWFDMSAVNGDDLEGVNRYASCGECPGTVFCGPEEDDGCESGSGLGYTDLQVYDASCRQVYMFVC